MRGGDAPLVCALHRLPQPTQSVDIGASSVPKPFPQRVLLPGPLYRKSLHGLSRFPERHPFEQRAKLGPGRREHSVRRESLAGSEETEHRAGVIEADRDLIAEVLGRDEHLLDVVSQIFPVPRQQSAEAVFGSQHRIRIRKTNDLSVRLETADRGLLDYARLLFPLGRVDLFLPDWVHAVESALDRRAKNVGHIDVKVLSWSDRQLGDREDPIRYLAHVRRRMRIEDRDLSGPEGLQI